jgi:hypothetical protein
VQFTRSPFQKDLDDEEDEVITFEGNPAHNLPRGGSTRSRHALSEDYTDPHNQHVKTTAELISPNKSK